MANDLLYAYATLSPKTGSPYDFASEYDGPTNPSSGTAGLMYSPADREFWEKPPKAHEELLGVLGSEEPTWKNVQGRDEKYKVDLAPVLTRRGIRLDSEAIYKHYAEKGERKVPGPTDAGKRAALTIAKLDTAPKDILRTWSRCLIWVCTKQNEFYSHVCKPRRFHHSSFTGGDKVRAAGMWLVADGHLKAICGHSGHYQPAIGHLIHALRLLDGSKALHDDTQALVVQGNDWKYVGVRELLVSNGAGFKSHPHSH